MISNTILIVSNSFTQLTSTEPWLVQDWQHKHRKQPSLLFLLLLPFCCQVGTWCCSFDFHIYRVTICSKSFKKDQIICWVFFVFCLFVVFFLPSFVFPDTFEQIFTRWLFTNSFYCNTQFVLYTFVLMMILQ